MDRLAAGIVIAIAALVMSGGLVRDAQAGESALSSKAEPASVVPAASPIAVAHGPRSERVLSLLLTLEALRAAPALLDTAKV